MGLKKRISLNGTKRLLTDVKPAGYLHYPAWGIPLMKAKHEGYISIETYIKVQEIIKDRSKPRNRRDTNPDFPLRNLLLCSHFHKPLTASWNTSRKRKKYPNYFCKTNSCPKQWKVMHQKKST